MCLDYEYDRVIPCYFAVSNYCNIRCSYCYVPEINKSQRDQLDETAILRATQMAEKARKERFAFSRTVLHGAEPTTLSPLAFREVVEILSSVTVNGKVSVQTNGVGLNKKFHQKMGDISDKLIIGVTLDVPKQVHDKHRQNTFNKVLENLMLAGQLGYIRRTLIGVSAETLDHLGDFAKTIAYFHRFLPDMNIAIKHIKGEQGMTDEQKVIWADFLWQHKIYDYDHTFWGNLCQVKGNDCLWFEFMMDGGVVSCNKQFAPGNSFANWLDDSIDEVIEKRKGIYQDYKVSSDCEKCSYKSICNGSCPVDRDENGNALDCIIRKRVFHHMNKAGVDPFETVKSTPVHFRQNEFRKWKRYGKKMGWVNKPTRKTL